VKYNGSGGVVTIPNDVTSIGKKADDGQNLLCTHPRLQDRQGQEVLFRLVEGEEREGEVTGQPEAFPR
jgi:hypothetical protein